MRPNYVPDIQSFLSKKFLTVSEKQRKPGDVVIWKDTGAPPGSGKEPYGHIGIVMPDGRIANNSTSNLAITITTGGSLVMEITKDTSYNVALIGF
jgi:hypothetical protein